MQLRSEETRKKILEAAFQCFAHDGYESSSVDSICRAAGVSKGAFYHHFPTKQKLFLTLLEDWLAGLEPVMQQLIDSGADIPSGLLRLASMSQPVFEVANGRLPMFLEFWDQAAHDPLVWEATVAPYRRFQQLFADAIRRGIAEGSLRGVDADVAARTLLSIAVGCLLQGLLDPQGADWNRVMRESVAVFLEGLRERKTEEEEEENPQITQMGADEEK